MLRFFRRWAPCLALVGCTEHIGSGTPSPVPSNLPEYDASAPMGRCGAVSQQRGIEGFDHVAVCSPVTYVSNPPSSGNHYPIWAAYQTYTTAVPEGFWVHNLEHGTIVFTYNCPNGCADDVAAAQTLIDSLPSDPVCVALNEGVTRRSLMTPDPSLDVEFAASAWGWTLRADCFDPDVFRQFALSHYDQGREDLCDQGSNVLSGLPANCGNP
jgi:hypothetical protein